MSRKDLTKERVLELRENDLKWDFVRSSEFEIQLFKTTIPSSIRLSVVLKDIVDGEFKKFEPKSMFFTEEEFKWFKKLVNKF